MKSDHNLRQDIEQELEDDSRVDAREIGVAVKEGIVTLSGHVRSYAERWAAQDAARLIDGVKALANEIAVKLPSGSECSDTEIAQSAMAALGSNISVPAADLNLTVHDGWITLTGQVAFWFQKQNAEAAVRHLLGVKGVGNEIKVKAQASKPDIKTRIEQAFRRHAQIDADKIRINVADGTVTLEGEVESWREREAAAMAVWSAPGVNSVQDRLVVR